MPRHPAALHSLSLFRISYLAWPGLVFTIPVLYSFNWWLIILSYVSAHKMKLHLSRIFTYVDILTNRWCIIFSSAPSPQKDLRTMGASSASIRGTAARDHLRVSVACLSAVSPHLPQGQASSVWCVPVFGSRIETINHPSIRKEENKKVFKAAVVQKA